MGQPIIPSSGIREYWIIDPMLRELRVLIREGDVWSESIVREGEVYRTVLLPGLEVRLEELLEVNITE